MRTKTFSLELKTLLTILTVILFAIAGMAAEKKLHNFFSYQTDGYGASALVFGSDGNLYGTTSGGGDYGGGTVFELTRRQDGGWTEKKLHNFRVDGIDGNNPQSGVVFDSAGNIYGTTYNGGNHGLGTVFELMPNGGGGWTEKKLHNFDLDDVIGESPAASLTIDAAGNLYGTATGGGTDGNGTVFKLTPDGSGGWTIKTAYSFFADGRSPNSKLVFDTAGNLYGTSFSGGSGVGTVFELTPDGTGGWTETILHSFPPYGGDGAYPNGVVLDAAGNLYGTTQLGGNHGDGIVFQLIPNHAGSWTEKKLHNFGNYGGDGLRPYGGLVLDAAGNLYGTASAGGDYSCGGPGCGIVFKMMPREDGGWTINKLHNFGTSDTDGTDPTTGLIFDAAGNLYGTTGGGGMYNNGTVFEITR